MNKPIKISEALWGDSFQDVGTQSLFEKLTDILTADGYTVTKFISENFKGDVKVVNVLDSIFQVDTNLTTYIMYKFNELTN